MESRAGCTDGDVEHRSDLLEWQPDMQVEDDDRPVGDRECREASFELVAIVCLRRAIDDGRIVCEKSKWCDVATTPSGFCIAGIDDEPVRPRVEAIRLAKGRQLAPGDQEGLLGGVLSEFGVAQDPISTAIRRSTAAGTRAANASSSPFCARRTRSACTVYPWARRSSIDLLLSMRGSRRRSVQWPREGHRDGPLIRQESVHPGCDPLHVLEPRLVAG